MWYYPGRVDLPPNPTASALFKLQLFGDVLIVQQSRENSFLPRTRCIPFYVVHYDGEARPLLQCNVFQPMCVDVALAYAGVSIMQPHVFEIGPGDMHLSIMARVTPSVAMIKYSLLPQCCTRSCPTRLPTGTAR